MSIFFLFSGCSSTPRAIVDTYGVDPEKYNSDLAQCTELANQVDTTGEIAESALGGALVGGVIGSLSGKKDSALTGAGVGSALGALGGYGESDKKKDKVIRNCLSNRGYTVLN